MKDIDWSLLVNDIQDNNFLSQTDLSAMLKVSQQSISNWQGGTRNPSADAKRKLVEIASKSGIDIKKYRMEPEVRAISKYIDTEKGGELVRIFEQYTRMSQVNKKKFMEYAVKLSR
ncbi:MAG: helix-turn-helix transcriptional regulator [Victivallales bacterium]|jgi:predicted transcriptional regulator